MAPHFLLHHVKAEYELVLVDRKNNWHKSEEYLKLNPAGRIPTLVFGVTALFESAAICIYVSEQYPQYKLIPACGEPNRALFFQWLSFLTNTLQAELMVRYYPHKHTINPDNVNDIKEAQDERIAEALAIIDEQLQGNEYLLGNTLSACDYFLFMLSEWSLIINKPLTSFKNLTKYLNHMSVQPTIIDVCAIEGISLERFGNLDH